MKLPLSARIVALVIAGSMAASAVAQDRSRDESVDKTLKLLKAPTTPAEYWDAVKFSLNVGKQGDAILYLDKLLATDPPAELLLTIRERDAALYFPKLTATPELQQRAAELVRHIERAAQSRARDPERIQMFIQYLTRTPQHRAYGIAQLRTAGADAVPHLLAALRDPGLAEHRTSMLHAMQRLDHSAVPALVAALDSPDQSLVSDVVDVLSVIGDADTIPHLRYLAEAPEIPNAIQSHVRVSIEKIAKQRYAELPAATEAMTKQADRYYNHQVDLQASSAGTVRLWRWVPPEGLQSSDVTSSYAELYFGLIHCRHALTLNPATEAAQSTIVSLALEKATESAGVDQALREGPGQASAAGLSSGADLLVKVLGRSIEEKHPAVTLSALRLLARTADWNSMATKNGVPAAVMNALALGDRRIQFAAAEVILSLRPQDPIPASSQVVSILAQSLASGGNSKALVIDPNLGRGSALAALLSQSGYQTRFVPNAREGFAYAAATIDYDLIFIDANIYDPELTPAIANFRTDARTAAVPIVVLGNGTSSFVVDDLEQSLRSGDTAQALLLLRQLGEKVVESKVNSYGKDSVLNQITESAAVIRRLGSDAKVLPPSRVFMTLYLAELGKVARQVKLIKSDDVERAALLEEVDRVTARMRETADRLAQAYAAPGVTARAVSYPGEKELTKFERRYPRVKYLARPATLETLKLQLASLAPIQDAKPLSASERSEQARRAAGWLARIARGEIRGFDIRSAESAILSAMPDDAVGPDAIAAAGRIPTASSQAGLARLVVSESASMPLRIEATRELAESLRSFGNMLGGDDSAAVHELHDRTVEPVLHQALAATIGAMRPKAGAIGDRLRRLPTPPFDGAAAPGSEPPPPREPDAQP
jgi:CheY-like chemotaxis protein